jgi:hypothetical protein
MADELNDTEDLRSEQERKAADEERRARAAESEEDTKTHERRAEKSKYLREKLAERDASERAE